MVTVVGEFRPVDRTEGIYLFDRVDRLRVLDWLNRFVFIGVFDRIVGLARLSARLMVPVVSYVP